jgi:hypothetical protein
MRTNPVFRNWRRVDGAAGKVAATGMVPGSNSRRQRGHFPGAFQMTSGWDGHTHPLMKPYFGSEVTISNLRAFESSGLKVHPF